MLSNTNENFVLSNLIGVGYDPAITTLGNGLDGIFIGGTSTGNIIGGSEPARNVISCNYQHGIPVSGASDNEISYNHIGTDYDGSLDLGNLYHGVYVTGNADDVHIEHNVISGNGQHGVYLKGTGIERTIISSNRIGSNADADAVIANDYHGIVLEGEAINNGPTGSSITDNIIIGSGWSGLVFIDAPKNETLSNYIGVSPYSDSTDLGNVFFGIHILGSDNTLYWDTIAHNGLATSSAGIRVDGSTALSNSLWPISIYNNGGKGIENYNGGNAGLLGPVFDAEHTCTHVSGTIPEPLGYVDIYTGPDDEGKIYKGSAYADGSGHFEYTGSIAGPYVSAKWTDSAGNTSEFSAIYLAGTHIYRR